jgi:serine/threonine-protein kinase RsbW
LIRLTVPGSLIYRDLVLRVASSACKLTRAESDRADDFDNEVVSAFGEAFNNICIHGYAGRPAGEVEIELDIAPGVITIRVRDDGRSFDPTIAQEVPPSGLRESGMGLYIMRSFMDLSYRSGPPNVLCLSKRRTSSSGQDAMQTSAQDPGAMQTKAR